MTEKKIAFIGGGSYQWGIPLIRDMLVTKGLNGSELVLMDIDLQAAKDVKKAAEATQRRARTKWKISATTSRKQALKGADFVIISISTGGFDSMEHDLNIPWSYGVHQTVGDTVGPGGLNRGLRNIPVFLDIANDINRLCPDAWVLNITNPMTTLTKTLSLAIESQKVVGLCHEVYGGMDFVADMLNLDRKEPTFDVKVAGINHCIWLLEASYKNRDILPDLKKACASLTAAKKFGKINDDNVWIFKGNTVKRELMSMTGYLPMVGDRHVVEFFGHFTHDRDGLPANWHAQYTTIEERRTKWLPPMRQKTRDIGTGKEKIPLKLSHEPVAPIMDALANNCTYNLKAGNLPNNGQIPDLPLGSVVETPCVVTSGGIHPVATGQLPSSLAAILSGHVYRQDMIVDAGITGDKDLVLQALISDPMVQDASTAKKMLKEMMDATAEWLPQFYTKAQVKKLKANPNKTKSTRKTTTKKTETAPIGSTLPKEISGR